MAQTVQTNLTLLFACWATVIVLAAMVVVFLRAKKKNYALAVVPLALPALMYIVSGVLARWLVQTLTSVSSFQIRIGLDLFAALVACVLIGFASNIISGGKRNRLLFCGCCTVFILIFSGLLIMSSVVQINVLT